MFCTCLSHRKRRKQHCNFCWLKIFQNHLLSCRALCMSCIWALSWEFTFFVAKKMSLNVTNAPGRVENVFHFGFKLRSCYSLAKNRFELDMSPKDIDKVANRYYITDEMMLNGPKNETNCSIVGCSMYVNVSFLYFRCSSQFGKSSVQVSFQQGPKGLDPGILGVKVTRRKHSMLIMAEPWHCLVLTTAWHCERCSAWHCGTFEIWNLNAIWNSLYYCSSGLYSYVC